jgi:DNA-binding LacI/PurR family transcriptional regulator
MSPRPVSSRGAGRVGVREVADLAGVSTQTVSRVLNGSTSVREHTRGRVLEAMAQLRYRPNNAARALGTAQTRTLGVVATDVTLYGPSAAIAALAGATRDLGRWLATAYADANDEASVEAAVAHLLAQGVDGIAVVAPHAQAREALLSVALDLPVVFMHGGTPDRQSEGAAMVVDHLVGLGHVRIARVGGPADWLEEASRRAGFDAALAAHGLREGPGWVGDWSAEAGALVGSEVAVAVQAAPGPTAIVVANDQMALGLMTELRRHGVRVPDDVSVVGFDDNPDAAYYDPALTTVRLDVIGEARRCVAAVFGADRSEQPGPAVLIARSSTAPPG